MRNIASRLLVLVALLPSLSACDGGGSVASAPPPAKPPLSVTLAALVSPTQTASPTQLLATNASPTIANTGTQTVFPLLQTAIDGSFGGDAETTGSGATLTHDAATGRYYLTLNNGVLNVSNV